MAWTYNSIRIYVVGIEDDSQQIIARLQPLASGTVHHIFGYETPIFKLDCKVVGFANLEALKALRTTGTAYVLSGPDSFSKTAYLSKITAKRDEFAYQTIDTAQDCEAPVFTVTMELYEQ